MARLEKLVEPGEKVISGDDSDPHTAAVSRSARRLAHRLRACGRVYATRVCYDAHPALDDGGQHALHRTDEIARISGRGVALPLLLEDGHGDFRQIVQHEVVHLSAFDLTTRCVERIAPESLTGCDANYSTHANSPRCGGSTNGPR